MNTISLRVEHSFVLDKETIKSIKSYRYAPLLKMLSSTNLDFWERSTGCEISVHLERNTQRVLLRRSNYRTLSAQFKEYVNTSLHIALWAFYHTDNFSDGALKAINLGYDAGTYGAIYGQLAGAYYGVN